MQTTLRLDDRLYREAKAEAARKGITITRFLEDSLRASLGRTATRPDVSMPRYDCGKPFDLSPEELKRLDLAEQERADLDKLFSPNIKS